jgi:hypothetical protein
MKTLRTPFTPAVTAIAVLLAIPATATAEEAVVPPSNSAAAQYTEAFPTSGGDKKTDQAHHRSPIKVLGTDKTKKLEKQGPAGKAAAEAAAATAPTSVASTTPAHTPSAPSGGDDRGGQRSGGEGNHDKAGGNAGQGATDKQNESAVDTAAAAAEPSGSSGLGSTIEQATGLSTGGRSGPLLLLVIVATVLCSLAYFWRRRHQVG